MSNWWSSLTRPGLKKRDDKAEPNKPDDKREAPDGLWIKCPVTGELEYQADIEARHWVTKAGFHMRIGPDKRFKQLMDEGFEVLALPDVPRDPLRFKDDRRYTDRLRAARGKVGRDDCMGAAAGRINGAPAVLLVQDFEFMGGSLGMAAGEGFITAARAAVARKAALICVAAAGGARMQEGILSLMQMPRTTLAIQELKRAGLPYLVVLTDPTTGGVTASYAMLGDVHIAEPGALIGFAGPRVIEQTIRQKLPERFQTAEYLHEKGMVDMVVDRRELKPTLGRILGVLMVRTPLVQDTVSELSMSAPLEAKPPAPAASPEETKPAQPGRKPAFARSGAKARGGE